jgi:hypothetical protein
MTLPWSCVEAKSNPVTLSLGYILHASVVAQLAVRELIFLMIARPDFRSTRVRMQWCRSLPIMVSPSQCPRCSRVSTSEGRVEMWRLPGQNSA